MEALQVSTSVDCGGDHWRWIDCHSVEESDATRDHHSATALQRSNETSDYQNKSCYLTTANRGNHAEQRDDLDTAVGYAFSAEDNEITYHGE